MGIAANDQEIWGKYNMSGRVVARMEIATALGKTISDFNDVLPGLYSMGFPHPLGGIDDHWLVVDLLDWVSAQQEAHVRFVEHIERWLLPRAN
ncbi:MAG: hypothetical protein LCH46_08055 [Proteobacteria bacterium]|nr:hypothetical protein [Pseudomonadota bacterium]